jgi:hypothetical protein
MTTGCIAYATKQKSTDASKRLFGAPSGLLPASADLPRNGRILGPTFLDLVARSSNPIGLRRALWAHCDTLDIDAISLSLERHVDQQSRNWVEVMGGSDVGWK